MLDETRMSIRHGDPVRQIQDFKSGNEAAALAARDIGFHVMGYFPILCRKCRPMANTTS